ncbi:trypsin-like peptidase domain-containing protein [Tolypothrix sp. PCC 7910]|uniref:trypsin-like peptidase domain-containing protein n=1 Tax=Tolypothrix sp. PCC 7910 TaxID=2099387 RepID=UPI00142780E9|nr:trypsin-like peptidase domain-containing protein [Tolypothrix sp. PCC 7910]QIR40306.1 trypsin-like peptidase domain-containing protein [Tolypothrix sp. PCC 7910]
MSDESQYERYKKAIARIYRAEDGAVVGSGVLVFERYVLTCAHVVADALGIAHTTQDYPESWVELDFPISDARHKPKIKAKVVFWRPISLSGQWEYGDDIAALELQEELIANMCPVGLALAGSPMNKFQTLGFPVGYDDGVWTYGEFRGEQGTGWVQIVVTNQSDYFVEGGFSGAPVWDDTIQAVAGIIVAAELNNENEKRKAVKAAFMIPAKILGEFWSKLKSYIVDKNHSLAKTSTSPELINPYSSSEQQIADSLLLLNYSTQEKNFREVMECQSEGAFLIRAKEERIQRWLVRRLAGCVPDFQRAQRFSIRIPNHPMRHNFEEFWSEFKLDSVNNPSCESVIQSLAKLSRDKSVIIAMYGLRFLEQEKMAQLHNFWVRLIEEVRSIPREKRYFRSRLLLLLAEGNSSNLLSKLSPFEFVEPTTVKESQYPFSLESLELISPIDVETWLAKEIVYSSLNKTPEEVQTIVCNDIPNWDQEPSQVLEEICQTVFQIPDGIAAIEPYWKLAG